MYFYTLYYVLLWLFFISAALIVLYVEQDMNIT